MILAALIERGPQGEEIEGGEQTLIVGVTAQDLQRFATGDYIQLKPGEPAMKDLGIKGVGLMVVSASSEDDLVAKLGRIAQKKPGGAYVIDHRRGHSA